MSAQTVSRLLVQYGKAERPLAHVEQAPHEVWLVFAWNVPLIQLVDTPFTQEYPTGHGDWPVRRDDVVVVGVE